MYHLQKWHKPLKIMLSEILGKCLCGVSGSPDPISYYKNPCPSLSQTQVIVDFYISQAQLDACLQLR